MMARAMLTIATLAAACGCGAAPRAPDRPATRVTSPTAAPAPAPSPAGDAGVARPDGGPRRVAFAAGAPVLIEPLLITGRKPGVIAECAVRVAGQELVTIGGADTPTEVLECHGLRAAGALPPAEGHRRLALIYATGSPNVDYRTPVVLVEGAGGAWAIDDTAFDLFDGNDPHLSVAVVARKLRPAR